MPLIIILTVCGIIAMFSGVFNYRKMLLPITTLALLGCVAVAGWMWYRDMDYFEMMHMDVYSLAFSVLCILSTLAILIFYNAYYKEDNVQDEIYALTLFGLVGVVLLCSYTHLVMLFLGIETLSLSLYILAGIRRHKLTANEAAVKYFLMGAFSTGIMLFGIALVYGATGSFALGGIKQFIANEHGTPVMLYAGILLIMTSMLFKIAAAPFHMWTPDVYQGSDTIVTAFMATVAKVASMYAFIRLFGTAFASLHSSWVVVINIVAVITMFIGNITAIYQTNFKRMLAYSSIAHAGYMLLALSGLNDYSLNAVFMYGIAYSAASIIAFAVIIIVSRHTEDESTNGVNGLMKANPLMAVALVVAMLSLAGIPITAGFFAKFYIFSAAAQGGFIWVVVLGVLNSAISVYYYFRPIINTCFKEGTLPKIQLNFSAIFLFVLLTLILLVAGILPALFMPQV